MRLTAKRLKQLIKEEYDEMQDIPASDPLFDLERALENAAEKTSDVKLNSMIDKLLEEVRKHNEKNSAN
tara:strand:- start:14798 stop:15004 length:207 start_codon:yes stop_codon:yes gene_type:complete